jgi:hypothetical protein
MGDCTVCAGVGLFLNVVGRVFASVGCVYRGGGGRLCLCVMCYGVWGVCVTPLWIVVIKILLLAGAPYLHNCEVVRNGTLL